VFCPPAFSAFVSWKSFSTLLWRDKVLGISSGVGPKLVRWTTDAYHAFYIFTSLSWPFFFVLLIFWSQEACHFLPAEVSVVARFWQSRAYPFFVILRAPRWAVVPARTLTFHLPPPSGFLPTIKRSVLALCPCPETGFVFSSKESTTLWLSSDPKTPPQTQTTPLPLHLSFFRLKNCNFLFPCKF